MQSATVTLGQYNGRTRLFSLSLSTNQGRSIAAGTPTSERHTLTAPTGWHIAGFTGRAGDDIDTLGVIYRKERARGCTTADTGQHGTDDAVLSLSECSCHVAVRRACLASPAIDTLGAAFSH
ncbi:hypothetical protein ACU14_19235 [Xanthomonas oryzae pv. oryzicola]|nr:hypothetical protein ACU15_18760 [Xanthomonas oryzae pv. oryzicola]AKO13789.1 hypothetical protein ACU14_19235 [Xanthomonas oryzae pv. oryzicola]